MAPINNNSNLTRSILPLTEEEKSIICGTMLGDGHIQKRSQNSYRLKIDHSIKQKDYVLWKRDKLKRLCTTTHLPKITTDRRGFEGIEFYTSSGLYLKDFHEKFYVPKTRGKVIVHKKAITKDLIAWLPKNPLVLATWFLDDGSVRSDCFSGRLATQGFSLEDCELLCDYLESCGVVGARIVSHKKARSQFTITLPAKTNTFRQLVDLIEPIVRKEIPSMIYKLNDDWNK